MLKRPITESNIYLQASTKVIRSEITYTWMLCGYGELILASPTIVSLTKKSFLRNRLDVKQNLRYLHKTTWILELEIFRYPLVIPKAGWKPAHAIVLLFSCQTARVDVPRPPALCSFATWKRASLVRNIIDRVPINQCDICMDRHIRLVDAQSIMAFARLSKIQHWNGETTRKADRANTDYSA